MARTSPLLLLLLLFFFVLLANIAKLFVMCLAWCVIGQKHSLVWLERFSMINCFVVDHDLDYDSSEAKHNYDDDDYYYSC